MQYTIKKHCGLRVDMKHIYNGSYGSFNDIADAIAWAHFKHDNVLVNVLSILLLQGRLIRQYWQCMLVMLKNK